MKYLYPLIVAAVIVSCKHVEKKEEIQFNGRTFGFEATAQTTLETTLRFRKIYMKRVSGGDEKVFVGANAGEMDFFPVDSSFLRGTEYVVIDTVTRGVAKFPPTREPHTLYLDPDVFSKDDFDVIVAFVKSNYEHPIDSNQLVKWLDYTVLGLEPGNVYFTVYAIVHKNLSSLQTEYNAPEGHDHFLVHVDNHLHVSKLENDLQSESYFDYNISNDTLYYPSYEGEAAARRLLSFKDKEGKAFGDRAKVLTAIQPD